MIQKKPIEKMAINFIPKEFSGNKKDPYYYMNKKQETKEYRNLFADEIEILIKNNNFAEDWNEIFVTDKFDPSLIKNCEFFGRITIGKLRDGFIEFNDLRLPIGISNSIIISSDIGDDVSIRDVHYLSHYIINNNLSESEIAFFVSSDKSVLCLNAFSAFSICHRY